jgi:hypothetical protein
MTVLYYDAGREEREDGRVSATATLVARNSTGLAQEYPAIERER